MANNNQIENPKANQITIGVSRNSISAGAKVQILQIILCVALLAVVVASYLFGEQQKQTVAQELAIVGRLDKVSNLTLEIKNVQIDVIQVQQFFTDISATRGLDGLDDGAKIATEHGDSFQKRSANVLAAAKELDLPEVTTAITDAQAKFPAYFNAGKAMAEKYVAEGPTGGNKLMGNFDASAEAMGNAIDKLVEVGNKAAQDSKAQALSLEANTTSFMELLLALGGVAIMVGVAAVIYTFILERSAKSARRLANELTQRHQSEQSAKDAASAFIINMLGQGLQNLAKGDLTQRLTEEFPMGLDSLRIDFNSAADSLQETISSVKKGTDGIRSGTDEIAQASDDLSRRTENQAANLEQTAAAVAEITSAVKKTATGAIHARSVVTAAKTEADNSGEVVRKAVEAMHGIQKSSQKINQIIGVIDEIAFQTNLLALNAGVEAARAGDAGRGFAVVASEVRALAQRSATAAKEIKDLLSASKAQVEDGVQLVGETGASLRQIVERVTEINSIVAEIAASAEQQSSGLQEVNTAVDQMDQVTQQNAAMVEEATAATRTLTQQTGDLARVVARFTTSAASAIDDLAERTRLGSAMAQKGISLSTPKKREVKVMATNNAVAGKDGWEEF